MCLSNNSILFQSDLNATLKNYHLRKLVFAKEVRGIREAPIVKKMYSKTPL